MGKIDNETKDSIISGAYYVLKLNDFDADKAIAEISEELKEAFGIGTSTYIALVDMYGSVIRNIAEQHTQGRF